MTWVGAAPSRTKRCSCRRESGCNGSRLFRRGNQGSQTRWGRWQQLQGTQCLISQEREGKGKGEQCRFFTVQGDGRLVMVVISITATAVKTPADRGYGGITAIRGGKVQQAAEQYEQTTDAAYPMVVRA